MRKKSMKITNLCTVCNENESKYKCPKCRKGYCSVACCQSHKKNYCTATTTDSNGGKSKDKVNNDFKNVPKQSKYSVQNTSSSTFDTTAEAIESQNQNIPSINSKEYVLEDEEENKKTGWILTDKMKEQIKKSDWLRNELLMDQGLQKIIKDIVYPSFLGNNTTTNTNNKNINNRKRKSDQISALKNLPKHRNDALESAKLNCPQFNTFVEKMLLSSGILMEETPNNADVAFYLEQSKRIMLTPIELMKDKKKGT